MQLRPLLRSIDIGRRFLVRVIGAALFPRYRWIFEPVVGYASAAQRASASCRLEVELPGED